MTPEGVRRMLAFIKQQDADASLRFDLGRFGPGHVSFTHGWPHHPALGIAHSWSLERYMAHPIMGAGRN